MAARNEQIATLLTNLSKVVKVLDARDQDIVGLMEDADVLFRALVARRDAVHNLLIVDHQLSQELTGCSSSRAAPTSSPR